MLIEQLKQRGISLFDMGTGDSRLKKSLAVKSGFLYKVVVSKNPVVRNLIISIYQLRNKVFIYLSNHRLLYLIYRRARQLFVHEI
jgi:CelD/BcsL family acetyltransferase involved in cellulose biosynthesis